MLQVQITRIRCDSHHPQRSGRNPQLSAIEIFLIGMPASLPDAALIHVQYLSLN
jgi:hypothetical protein